MSRMRLFTLATTSPATASTVVGPEQAGLSQFDYFMVDADLAGATGGTLDVYLQREVAAGAWRDWLHFPQLAAGGAAISYTVPVSGEPGVFVVGTGAASTASPALAANTFVGGHPGDKLRLVFVAGASTSAGAAITVRINAWLRRT